MKNDKQQLFTEIIHQRTVENSGVSLQNVELVEIVVVVVVGGGGAFWGIFSENPTSSSITMGFSADSISSCSI